MNHRAAHVMRIVAGLLAVACGLLFAAGLVFNFPLGVNLASSAATTAAAAVLMRATHVETELNQDGKQ